MTDALDDDDIIYNIYNRDGVMISEDIYRELIDVPTYVRFKTDIISSPNGDEYLISTIWRGIDYSAGMAGKPLIFETQVYEIIERDETKVKVKPPFAQQDKLPFDYYSDEYEAWSGHQVIVDHMRSTNYDN